MRFHFFLRRSVIVNFLTLCTVLSFGGCALIEERYGERCNSHAYIQEHLANYINQRFPSASSVRTAIIPFSVPANLASHSSERPGLGSQIVWKIHAAMLRTAAMPIVEVLNREDWPGKKEEFFTGNFGAIAAAREAGYDLALVGYMEGLRGTDSVTVYTKIIDVEAGITIWYGKTTVTGRRAELGRAAGALPFNDHDPSQLYFAQLFDRLGRCVVAAIVDEDTEVDPDVY